MASHYGYRDWTLYIPANTELTRTMAAGPTGLGEMPTTTLQPGRTARRRLAHLTQRV